MHACMHGTLIVSFSSGTRRGPTDTSDEPNEHCWQHVDGQGTLAEGVYDCGMQGRHARQYATLFQWLSLQFPHPFCAARFKAICSPTEPRRETLSSASSKPHSRGSAPPVCDATCTPCGHGVLAKVGSSASRDTEILPSAEQCTLPQSEPTSERLEPFRPAFTHVWRLQPLRTVIAEHTSHALDCDDNLVSSHAPHRDSYSCCRPRQP